MMGRRYRPETPGRASRETDIKPRARGTKYKKGFVPGKGNYMDYERYTEQRRRDLENTCDTIPAAPVLCLVQKGTEVLEWWLQAGAAVCVGDATPETFDGLEYGIDYDGPDTLRAAAIRRACDKTSGPRVALCGPDETPPGWLRYRFMGMRRERFAYIPAQYSTLLPDAGTLRFVEYGRGRVCPWSECRAALAVMVTDNGENSHPVAFIPCYASDE